MKDPRWFTATADRLEADLLAWLAATGVRKVWIDHDKYACLLALAPDSFRRVLALGYGLRFNGCEVHIR